MKTRLLSIVLVLDSLAGCSAPPITIDGDSTIINSYQGEYMSQYSWAEYSIFKRIK